MECWEVKQVKESVYAVELFIWTESITETECGLCHELNQQEVPSPNAI